MAARIGRLLPWSPNDIIPIVFWCVVSGLELLAFAVTKSMTSLLGWLLLELLWLPPAYYLMAGVAGIGGTRRLLRTGMFEDLVAAPLGPGTLLYGMNLRALRLLARGRWWNLFVLLVVCPALWSFVGGIRLSMVFALILLLSVWVRLGLLAHLEVLAFAQARRVVLCGPRHGALGRFLWDGRGAWGRTILFNIIFLICFAISIIIVPFIILYAVFVLYWFRRIGDYLREEAERTLWWTVEAQVFWRLRPEEESQAMPGSLRAAWPDTAMLYALLYSQSEEVVMPRWLLGELDAVRRK
jgi:hypothetical protein